MSRSYCKSRRDETKKQLHLSARRTSRKLKGRRNRHKTMQDAATTVATNSTAGVVVKRNEHRIEDASQPEAGFGRCQPGNYGHTSQRYASTTELLQISRSQDDSDEEVIADEITFEIEIPENDGHIDASSISKLHNNMIDSYAENLESTSIKSSDEYDVEHSEDVYRSVRNPEPDHVLEQDSEEQQTRNEHDADRIEEANIEGRRIVNVQHLFSEFFNKFGNHGPRFDCPMTALKIVGSREKGLHTQIFFQCQMCLYKDSIWTEPSDVGSMDIHRSAVAGRITSGIGYSQMEQLFAAIDVPNISENTYRKYEDEMTRDFMSTASKEMKAAGKLERELAIKRGDIVDGISHIPVVADGSWMKRSYRTGKYDSLSGVGAIVGYHTQKILFIGVRNKFCATCERAARTEKEPSEHFCYKNWERNRSSTSMESDAIVDGFKRSIDEHGLMYSTLIADGDSSVYKKILDSNPYPNMPVKKVECTNHLLRNLATKIKEVAKGKGRIGKLRQVIESSVLKLRTAVTKAVEFRSQEEGPTSLKARKLAGDILNAPSHVFGEHKKCAEIGYFCDGSSKEGEENIVPALNAIGLYDKIKEAFESLSCYSDSLILGVNSNSVERYNSIIAKYIGGKRINYGSRGSYTGRCAAAAVQFNTNESLSVLIENIGKEPPMTLMKMEDRHINRNDNKTASSTKSIEKRKNNGNNNPIDQSSRVRRTNTATADYGRNSQRPDLSVDEFEKQKQYHSDRLLEWQDDRNEIERTTRQQCKSERWMSIRKKILTASNFGRVCRMRADRSCENTVKSLLYPTPLRLPAIEHGQQCEEKARRELEIDRNIIITECGLFIDEELPYIGASPDGLIDNDGIVEIKCPFSLINFTPQEAIAQKRGNMHRIFDSRGDKMNENHEYHYQVQGQLHVTRRKYCIFAVWTPRGMRSIVVQRNDEFWSNTIEPYLMRFYEYCMIPEIVDSRYLRNMGIRDPQYILDARQDKQSKISKKG